MSAALFQGRVMYWSGPSLDSSEPAYTYGPDAATYEEAAAWAKALAGQPSPWPGRDYDEQCDVTEYDTSDPMDEVAVRRWLITGDEVEEDRLL